MKKAAIKTVAEATVHPSGKSTESVLLNEANELVVRTPDGRLCLRVSMELHEFVVECVAGGLRLRSSQTVQLEAPNIALCAETDMHLHAGRNMHLHAGGEVNVQADALELEATRGDAVLMANDDVRIDGERIRMNA